MADVEQSAPIAYDARLPLVPGDSGPAVADLQQRLTRLGHPCDGNVYDHETERAVRAFQRRRGLREDGVVDRRGWHAIVEAGHHLGDRLLYRTLPMLRGDDVADLQRRLSQLGFDSGRIDGIFGDETAEALADFQRNAGLRVDGICGRRTLGDLHRLTLRKGAGDLVSPLRERLILNGAGSRTLSGRRIAVGESGGFAPAVASVCRALDRAGATAIAVQHPDPSHRASEANASEVDCLVDLVLVTDRHDCTIAYYQGFRYESLASKQLAHLVHGELAVALGLEDAGIVGMALPVLRETRMPAIEVQLGAPALVVRHIAELGHVLTKALSRWVGAEWE